MSRYHAAQVDDDKDDLQDFLDTLSENGAEVVSVTWQPERENSQGLIAEHVPIKLPATFTVIYRTP